MSTKEMVDGSEKTNLEPPVLLLLLLLESVFPEFKQELSLPGWTANWEGRK